MNILQMIRRIFKKKVKMLEAASITQKNNNDVQYENNSLKNIKVNTNSEKEITIEEKVVQFFSDIGCSEATIDCIVNSGNIDINNLRKNINVLTNFKYTKLQLSTIIGTNIEILYIDNNKLQKYIESLKRCFNDDEIVKNIIYRNSSLINENIDSQINQTKAVLDKFEIPIEYQKEILDENINILSLNPNQLSDSLRLIKNLFKNQKMFFTQIVNNPQIIGVNNLSVIEKIINE